MNKKNVLVSSLMFGLLMVSAAQCPSKSKRPSKSKECDKKTTNGDVVEGKSGGVGEESDSALPRANVEGSAELRDGYGVSGSVNPNAVPDEPVVGGIVKAIRDAVVGIVGLGGQVRAGNREDVGNAGKQLGDYFGELGAALGGIEGFKFNSVQFVICNDEGDIDNSVRDLRGLLNCFLADAAGQSRQEDIIGGRFVANYGLANIRAVLDDLRKGDGDGGEDGAGGSKLLRLITADAVRGFFGRTR